MGGQLANQYRGQSLNYMNAADQMRLRGMEGALRGYQGAAQGMSNLMFAPQNMLANMYQMGQAQRGITQDQINADKARWDYYADPWRQLGMYNQNIINPQTGGTKTTSGNPFAGLVSGGLTGLGLYNQLGLGGGGFGMGNQGFGTGSGGAGYMGGW